MATTATAYTSPPASGHPTLLDLTLRQVTSAMVAVGGLRRVLVGVAPAPVLVDPAKLRC